MIGISVSQRQATRRIEQEQKQKPRGKSRVLLSFSLAVLFISIALWGFHEIYEPSVLPIRSVKIAGDFTHLDHTTLQKMVTSYSSKGFLGIDMSGLKESLQKLPWAYTASVWRVWPDTLQINITEQTPAAQWGDKTLLNTSGELFDPGNDELHGLPQLQGPLGEHSLVFHNYREMSALLAPLSLKIQWLGLAARHAWRLQLDNGMTVILGRDNAVARLAQFVKVYPQLFSRNNSGANSFNDNDGESNNQSSKRSINNDNNRIADYVDLRYEHGMAVHWKTV
jgi:cell division protein FtsQ